MRIEGDDYAIESILQPIDHHPFSIPPLTHH